MTERYPERGFTDPIGADAPPTTRLFIDERDVGALEPRTSLGTLDYADVPPIRPGGDSIGALGRFLSYTEESIMGSMIVR